jgi:integrase
VHRAFNWAARQRLIRENPFRGVTAPAGERGQPMEEAEFRAILRHSPPCFRRFVIALRMSGARPGELAKATLADVDEERACIELRKHKTAKKTGHARRIILHPVLCRYVAWRKRQSWQTPLLFPNSRGRKWSNPAICWRLKEVRRLGGELRPETSLYGMRHGWACRAVLKGVGLPIVAEMMGHTRVTTTMGYVHMAKETAHLQSELARMFSRAA